MPDLSIHLRSGSPDCTFHGRAVDVKATRRKPTPVWYTDWRPDKAMALYVFVMVDYATVDICGWVPEAVVRQRPGRAEWRTTDLRDPALLWQVPWPEEGWCE